MVLFAVSFAAGILTVLSPCVFAVLPLILGSAVSSERRIKPFIIIGSLMASIITFTIILRASTALIAVPTEFWQFVSGFIIIVLGFFMLFPDLWSRIETRFKFSTKADTLLADAGKRSGVLGDVLTGLALGPVFTSCSPTYGLIVAQILPISFLQGFVYLTAYSAGLGSILLAVSIFGRTLLQKIKWAFNPYGKFRRTVAIMFILLGVLIATGTEKRIEAYLLSSGFVNLTQFELNLFNFEELTN